MVKRSRTSPKFGPWMSAILKRNGTYKKRKYSPIVGKSDAYNGAVAVPRSVNSPFPYQRSCTLRYCTNISIDATVSNVAKHFFRANGLYDPDYTSTGHQPYGFDQIAAVYNHYEVLKSYITIEAQPASLGIAAGQMVVGICPSDDQTITLNIDSIREQKGCNWAVLDSYGKCRVSNNYMRKRTFPAEFQALGAKVDADPTEEHMFCVFASPMSSAVEPGSVLIIVTIDYVARFWENRDLGQS